MDPITAASAYATIVALVCTFKNERKGQRDQDANQFMGWLEAQHREDLKEFILRTAELPTEIDKLLKRDTDEILAKLKELRDSVVTLPNRIEHLAEMIQSTRSRAERLQLLPHLIAETERSVKQIEKTGLFILRSDTEKDWDIPIDAEALRMVFERLRTMHIDDNLNHTFIIGQSAAKTLSRVVQISGRHAKLERLLKAITKLINLREELDYLEQETKTLRA